MSDNATIETLGKSVVEQVERIIACADDLGDDGVNWKPPAEETNSVYVLATHVLGNVRQNVLAILGNQPDQRDRDAEFRASGSSAAALRAQWTELREQVQATLPTLGQADLERVHDHPRRGTVTGLQTLVISATHAAEHAGQAELTRDLYRAMG
jgi:hypothetical protein